jgi:hypothetical protein
MSVLRLDRVEGCVLYVRDLDILDQTPVLDLKPYVAYTDAIASASAGWLSDPNHPKAAEVEHAALDAGPRFDVEFVERAAEQLDWLRPRAAIDIEALASSVLSAGPAPHAYRRIREHKGYSVLAVKDFRLRFRVQGSSEKHEQRCIQVFEITSGYRRRVLADERAQASEQTPLSVHRDFVARFGEAGS